MLITNNKYKKALMEIDKVVYGKIKHLNNQARLLHIADILSKLIIDGKFMENEDEYTKEFEEDEDEDEEQEENNYQNEEEILQQLYKEFFENYNKANYYFAKADEVVEKINEIKNQNQTGM